MSTDESEPQDSDGEQHECPTCSQSFGTDRALKSHHTQAHGESLLERVEVECSWCGETLRRTQERAERTDDHFCDMECRGPWLSENNRGEAHPNYNSVETVCANCGETLTLPEWRVESREKNYCDYECMAAEYDGRDVAGNAGRVHNREYEHVGWSEYECQWCGDTVSKPPYYPDVERHFCDSECYDNWQRDQGPKGQDHWNWRGGHNLTKAVKALLPGDWDEIRREVYQRHDGRCAMCGEPLTLGEVNTHHIVPVVDGGVHDPDLAIPLCAEHHITAEWYTRSISDPVLVDWSDDELPEGRLSSEEYLDQDTSPTTGQATFDDFVGE